MATKGKKTAAKPAVAKSVKKKAPKAAPKKAAPKKANAAPKAPAATKISMHVYDVNNIPEDQHFFFVNGHRVKNVKELAEIMDRIEQEVFDYHVNEEKNDFYSWIRHVFDDIELAEKVVGVTSPKHLQFTIYKHVADKAMKK